MKKLLCLLLLLPLMVCAAEQTVPAQYLCARTLVVKTQQYPAYEYTVEYFLTLCEEADPATAADITPDDVHSRYDMSASVFADASGAAWLKDGERVYPLTNAPGQRITSLCPAYISYEEEPVMLFTRQDEKGTEVCEIIPETGEMRVLLSTKECLVLLWRDPLFSYNPLTELDYDLLCTAEITQPDPTSPLLSYKLLEVVGDVSLTDGRLTAETSLAFRYAITYDTAQQAAQEAFAAAYQQLNPDHQLQQDSIVERTDLLDNPDYGRLYTVRFNGSIWLWQEDHAWSLGNGRLTDALLADLTGDGLPELIYIYETGSGVTCQNVAYRDPVYRKITRIHQTTDRYASDPPLSLSLTEGVCTLLQDGEEIGVITQHGLDSGLSMIDFMSLTPGVSTLADVNAIYPGASLIATSFGGQMNLLLSDGTTLALKFIGPGMQLSGMEHCWRDLRLLEDSEELVPQLLDAEQETTLLRLIEDGAAPENFVGLLSGVRRQEVMGETVHLGLARTDSWIYLVWFRQPGDGDLQTYKFDYPLNHDRTALEAIRPGMTLEEVRAVSPHESQYPSLHVSWPGVPLNSVHFLPTGEELSVSYESAEGGYIVTEVMWHKP